MATNQTDEQVTIIAVGGRTFELRPITPRMSGELIFESRRRAIKEFMAIAKDAGLGFDLIHAQLRRLNDVNTAEERSTPEDLAYLLYLRSRHTGVTLDDALDLPGRELSLLQREIMDLPDDGDDFNHALELLALDPATQQLSDEDRAKKRTEILNQFTAALDRALEKKIGEDGGAADQDQPE